MKMKRFALQVCVTMVLAGCTGISVAPTCPNELEEGESGTVTGNVLSPGQVPTYAWTVEPADSGTFSPANQPISTFTAAKAGDAIVFLTASDGLYQVQSECMIRITAAPFAVTFRASPTNPATGDAVVLICESTTSVETFTITQTSGTEVILADLEPGRVRFTANVRGDYTFQCVGRTSDGRLSDPVSLALTVTQGRGGR